MPGYVPPIPSTVLTCLFLPASRHSQGAALAAMLAALVRCVIFHARAALLTDPDYAQLERPHLYPPFLVDGNAPHPRASPYRASGCGILSAAQSSRKRTQRLRCTSSDGQTSSSRRSAPGSSSQFPPQRAWRARWRCAVRYVTILHSLTTIAGQPATSRHQKVRGASSW